jgi:hypothetical protein
MEVQAPPDVVFQQVSAFVRRFGEHHAALAMHAAVPLGLTPELVHLIRANFVEKAPWIAEADLLLSPLCREAGGDFYEMDPQVRSFLVSELHRELAFGPARLRKVADFVFEYAARALSRASNDEVRGFLRVQQLATLAYLKPDDAGRALQDALRAGTTASDRPEALRLARLAHALADPLVGQRALLVLAEGVERAARGDEDGARRRFLEAGVPGAEVSDAIDGLRRPHLRRTQAVRVFLA